VANVLTHSIQIFASAEQADVGVVKVEGDEDEDDFTVGSKCICRAL